MISLAGVAVEFGTQELYRDVNLFVGPNDRIGLVGANGSGKSTILKMIEGSVEPTRGQVDVRKGTRIAYLAQTGAVVGERTVLEEALSAFSHLDEIHEEMVELEHRMHDASMPEQELAAILARYAVLQGYYSADAYNRESRAEKTLMSLGFSEDDFAKPVRQQSGGFQVRLALARELLEEPDVLLLDEPTNYLDIRSIEWLQNYLAEFSGAVVMIAHDRYLLDGLVRRIWGIESGRVLIYPGNYSDYLADKEQRDERQAKDYEEQQQFIKRTEHFIAKFKGRKDTAPRAMSRQKMLDKLELVEAPETAPVIRIRFPEAEEVYGKAFELKEASKGFGQKQVLSNVDLVVGGGERIGLFGANGQGKTTLLRMIAGELEPDSGSVWVSQKSQIAYYEQGAEEKIDPELTVLQAAAQSGAGFTENELKGILGTFLFSGDAVEKKVEVLSGGERSRLAIVRALLTPSNLLILDEPTNHLDIQSREILFEAMSRYQRTIVFAAHDRYMLDKLAHKTVRVEDGQAVLFPGNYAYASARARSHKPSEGSQKPKAKSQEPAPGDRRQKPKAKSQSPKPTVPSPKSKVHSPKSRVHSPKSTVHGPQSRVPSPESPVPPLDRIADIRQRLVQIEQAVREARAAFDLNRARALNEERRDLEQELEARKADQVEGGGT
ncbi:ABC-F family ATP-binding cassette domain-containing protein [candidate division WOR-3 bacterium]|nr:ABC-F family ATP-binding cassette domain-containing protein [candidate division WOR-3 bacterium]